MRLEKYISINGLRRKSFAEALNVSPSTIYRIVDGTRYPSPELARQIVQETAGAVTMDDLYGEPAE